MRIFAPLFVLLFFTSYLFASNEFNVKQLKDCSTQRKLNLRKLLYQSDLLIVSTLDGWIAALDANNKGTLIWSLLTNHDGLFSSTLNEDPLIKNALSYKVIPSFDGSLYKLIESSQILEPIPINADILLKNSLKLGDDLLINGGKEVNTYAIDVYTGELIYSCSFDDCTNSSKDENTRNRNILLIRQNRQKVKAINPENGSEQWKFSVAENNLHLLSEAQDCHVFDEQKKEQHGKEQEEEDEECLSFSIANGLVRSENHKNKEINWSHQFASPIANAWRYKHGKLVPIDLFNSASNTLLLNNLKAQDRKPIIYLGMHNNQFYVQNLAKPKLNPYALDLISVKYQKSPQFSLKPSTSNELQVISSQNALTQPSNKGMFVYDDEDYESLPPQEDNLSNMSYDYYYNLNNSSDTIDQIIIISLWHWWKEVLVISITMAILINAILAYIKGKLSTHFLFHRALDDSKSKSEPIKSSSSSFNTCSLVNEQTNKSQSQISETSSSDSNNFFNSRYFNDFEAISCLGKGGFGVVFEVRNKIDDCKYAIKRIHLPLNKNGRDKVMREVKALAKLDHQNIVRYYNSWLEVYPSDWKEKSEDKILENERTKYSFSSQAKVTSAFPTSKSVMSPSASNLITKSDNSNAFLCNENGLTDSYIVFQNESKENNINTNFKNDFKYDSSPSSLDTSIDEKIKTSPSSLNTYLYIQMQLCQRQTLREWLKTNQDRSPVAVCDIFIQIVNAVEHVHSMGLMHRDLKVILFFIFLFFF